MSSCSYCGKRLGEAGCKSRLDEDAIFCSAACCAAWEDEQQEYDDFIDIDEADELEIFEPRWRGDYLDAGFSQS